MLNDKFIVCSIIAVTRKKGMSWMGKAMDFMEQGCAEAKKVHSKIGTMLLCDEEDRDDLVEQKKAGSDPIIAQGCAEAKKVHSKIGTMLLCDEEN